MKLSQWIHVSAACVAALVVANTAEARSTYVAPLNAALGSSVSCEACHTGAPSGGNASYPIASTYRAGLDLAASDSDGDGFTNSQEANGASLNFNTSSVSPFTLAKAAESSTSTKVVVTGAGIVNETVVTDAYAQLGITVASGSEVVAAVSPRVSTFPATLMFAKPLTSTSKIYQVNHTSKTNTLITSGLTFNKNGSVTITGLTGPVDLVAVRVVPTAVGAGSQPKGEDKEGCMAPTLSVTTWMMLALLALGWMSRRKPLHSIQ